MKKFKLIKEYPGSPKLGTVLSPSVDKGNENTNNFYWEGSWFNPNKFLEFWQEVPKLEYQILDFMYAELDLISFKVTSDENIFQPSGLCIQRTAEQLLEERHRIHSIRRLSDGLIIKIGDTVVTKNTLTTGVVTGFKINDNTTSFKEGLWVTIKEGGMHLERIKEVKLPLFTTEDGVEIYRGNTYWCVNTAPHLWSLFEQTAKERTQLNKTVKAFFTKEAAQDYINDNQPCLSIRDCRKIAAMWNSNSLSLIDTIEGYIKENIK